MTLLRVSLIMGAALLTACTQTLNVPLSSQATQGAAVSGSTSMALVMAPQTAKPESSTDTTGENRYGLGSKVSDLVASNAEAMARSMCTNVSVVPATDASGQFDYYLIPQAPRAAWSRKQSPGSEQTVTLALEWVVLNHDKRVLLRDTILGESTQQDDGKSGLQDAVGAVMNQVFSRSRARIMAVVSAR